MAEEATDKPAEKEYTRPHGPKTKYTPENDVAKEQYKGPGASITVLGYLGAVHWIATVVGILSGAALAFAFHRQASGVIQGLQKTASRWVGEEGTNTGFVAFAGRRIRWLIGTGEKLHGELAKDVSTFAETRLKSDPSFIHGSGDTKVLNKKGEELVSDLRDWVKGKDRGFLENIAEHLFSPFRKVSKAAGIEAPAATTEMAERGLTRGSVAFIGGGLGGAVAWAASSIWSLIHGSEKSNKGKHQFARAKDEIWTLRAEYDALRQKYLDAKIQLEDLRATQGANSGELTISRDQPPKLDDNSQNTAPAPTDTQNDAEPKRREQPAVPSNVVTSVSRDAAVTVPQQALA